MMKVAKRAVVLLGVALFNTANAAEALPEDFVTAKPQVQLYMAYAEFKKSETNTLYPILKVDLDSLETILESKDVNDIVGVYTYKEQLKIGVVKEENSDNFKVVILDTNEDIWQKGEVMSTLIPYGDNLLLNVGGNPSTKRLIAYSERIEDGVFKYIGFTKNNDHVHFANDLPTEETYFKEEINENITYLRLGSFSGWNPTLGQAEKFYREIKGTLTKPNLIVDLRNNSGGGDRNSDIILKQLKSYSKKNAIFVLINHRTVSNAEHFTLKLAKLKNTTILGNPSNGTAAYEVKNSTFNLPSGKFVTVLTSKLHSKYLDIESKGIIPDVVLDSGSDWIEQTVEYINGKK